MIIAALYTKISNSLVTRFSAHRTQNYSRRQNLIKIFFIMLLLAFGYRIITVHHLEANGLSLQEKGSKQANFKYTTKAHRGDILDRNNKVLASNLILKKVNLDPTQVQKEFIPKLAQALMMAEQELQAVIKKKLSKHAGRKHLIIRKNLRFSDPILSNIKKLKTVKLSVCTIVNTKIDWIEKALIFVKLKTVEPTHKKCRKAKIAGVVLQTDTHRYYPKSASLAPLIGFIGYNKKGVSGIEGEFESVLAGQNGTTLLNFNQDSQGSYFNPQTLKTLKHGENIKLTIDANIQFHAYTAIKKSVEKHQADSGSAIILNLKGEILAMANYPAVDPNSTSKYNAKNYRNRILKDAVEPGSTMKPFTMLLALERKKITANDDELIDVTKRVGHIKPDGKYTQMTVKKILQKSHNLGTVKVAERLEKEDMYNTWRKLGFGRSLGLIANENTGLLRHYNTWAPSDKRTLSFGHGPMQTNLAQLARAYLVFANEGAIPPLKLIQGVNTYEQTVQVFGKNTTKKIADLLNAVVSLKGSGYRARIKGYNVAGKTGTAEIVTNGRYNKKGQKRTFFTGFVPVKNPKYIMAVSLDYPKNCHSYYKPTQKISCEGSNSAAIVFKEAMQNILTADQSIKLLTR
ncbi:Cell division protein FtsI [Peptidoglycan synthetase] [uncultured Candidatus Thioglobus sp.]|nr:Cell division protein FtsI [Peptidoglycan synthetase] [uncultured Candidatus Thioglobus sp.]